MGVPGIFLPHVSQNVNLPSDSGFLEERKTGEPIVYSLRKRISKVNERTGSLIADLL
jgi:hypothetical protein